MKFKHLALLTSIVSLPIASFSITSCGNKNEVTITLDANGGTIETTSLKVKKGTSLEDAHLPTPTKQGSSFSAWTFEDGKTIPSSYKFESNVTLKAQWDVTYVTVTLLNDDETTFETQQVASGTYYSDSMFSNHPTKQGYTFKYWTYNNGSSWVKVDTTYCIQSNVSFKAYFEQDIDPDQKYIDDLNIKSLCSDNNHIYEASYDTYSQYYELQYLKGYDAEFSACCSTFYKNGFVGRNLDWTYDDHISMVLHTPNNGERYGTVGVSWCPGLTPTTVGKKAYISSHKEIPYWTVDGINDQGLCVSVNEVPLDEKTSKNYGDGTSNPKLTEIQLVRYLLDYAKSIDDAKQVIKNVNVIGLTNYNEMHLFLADATGKCAEIEFVEKEGNAAYKEPKFLDKDNSNFVNIATNFNFDGYDGDCDENWYKLTTSLSSKAEGCERYNILYKALVEQNQDINSLDDVLSLLSSVYYTKTYSQDLTDYSDTFWFSEFNYSTCTKTTEHTIANYKALLDSYPFDKAKWEAKTHQRTSKLYCTKTSSAYDIANKQLKLVFEEKYGIDKVFKIVRE